MIFDFRFSIGIESLKSHLKNNLPPGEGGTAGSLSYGPASFDNGSIAEKVLDDTCPTEKPNWDGDHPSRGRHRGFFSYLLNLVIHLSKSRFVIRPASRLPASTFRRTRIHQSSISRADEFKFGRYSSPDSPFLSCPCRLATGFRLMALFLIRGSEASCSVGR